ncbi:MAG TPA: hypothetical protein VF597_01730 [Candidatus Saccharimonadales bacterium]
MPRPDALAGPELIDVFLKELRSYIDASRKKYVVGMPSKIVADVINSNKPRFVGCSEAARRDLRRQVALAVTWKGRPYQLEYQPEAAGVIRVVRL